MGALNFDSNVWYQITNPGFVSKQDLSLRVGDSFEAIYMYTTNNSSPHERWQIYPALGGGGWNIRSGLTGSQAYMTQCEPSSVDVSTSVPTDTDVCMALGNPEDIVRRWILTSNGNGTYNIGLNSTNPAFQGYSLYVTSKNYVTFTTNTSNEATDWVFNSIAEINDPAFSSGVPGATVTSTSSGTATKTGHQSGHTATKTGSSSSKSSGLSSGASAGIGVGIGVLALILVALLAFWLIRRRRRQRLGPTSDAQRYQMVDHNQQGGLYGNEYKHEMYTPGVKAETVQPPTELQQPPAELHHHSIAELGAESPHQYPR